MTRARLIIAALPICGCAGGPDPWLEPADLDVEVQRSGFAHLGGIGLSGSALDDMGRLWAIPERQRALIKLERDADDVVRVSAVPLDGVPDELDTESLAWLGGDRFAIGTERRLAGRGIDAVLLVRLIGDRARVTGAIPFDYRELFQISAPSNEGIEGLCSAGVHLIAGGEPVVVDAGRRFATVARRRLDRDEDWTPYLVQLTTATGKISALDCWTSNDSVLHVLGVERHYHVTRIIHFGVPDSGGPQALRAQGLANLDSRFERMPNIEGIVREGNRILLLTDHDSLGQAGATESIRIGPFDTDATPREMDDDDYD